MIYIKKIYTYKHKKKDLEDGKYEKRFSSKEHSALTEIELKDNILKSKSNLLKHWFHSEKNKLDSLTYLIKYIKENSLNNILSLGSGTCVFEYLLKKSLPETYKVTATDFDSFYIEKGKEFFPELKIYNFDFFDGSFKEFFGELNEEYDLVYFLGSSYVMDYREFLNLLTSIKEFNVKKVIDFHAGYISFLESIKYKKNDFF
tara:strand:+ start:342 stop:947 length:606 start_codon:yes stop_codon:yes gene_type:complete